MRWKPDDSGSYKAKNPSHTKSYQDGNLERKNYVWNGKGFPNCSRDEGLQLSTAWNKWDTMDSTWPKEVEFRWAAAVFRTRGRTSGAPKIWHFRLRPGSLTAMSSLFYYMAQRLGEQQWQLQRRCRPLSTHVYEESCGYAGLSPSNTKTCRCWDNDETLEMDRLHSPKAFYQHHKTSPVLESPGKEEKGTAQELVETGLGSRHQEIGADLESARKENPRQR